MFTAGQVLDVAVLNELNKGRVLKREHYEDNTPRTFGNTWSDGMIFPNFTREKSGSESDIEINWRIPTENASAGWGGGYVNVLYSTDNGATWTSIGASHHDGGVMVHGEEAYGNVTGHHVLRNISGNQIRFKFRHRSYDGTFRINLTTSERSGMFNTNFYIKEISA